MGDQLHGDIASLFVSPLFLGESNTFYIDAGPRFPEPISADTVLPQWALLDVIVHCQSFLLCKLSQHVPV